MPPPTGMGNWRKQRTGLAGFKCRHPIPIRLFPSPPEVETPASGRGPHGASPCPAATIPPFGSRRAANTPMLCTVLRFAEKAMRSGGSRSNPRVTSSLSRKLLGLRPRLSLSHPALIVAIRRGLRGPVSFKPVRVRLPAPIRSRSARTSAPRPAGTRTVIGFVRPSWWPSDLLRRRTCSLRGQDDRHGWGH